MVNYITSFYDFIHSERSVKFRIDSDGGLIIDESVKFPPYITEMYREALVALFGQIAVDTVPLEQLPGTRPTAKTHRGALQTGQELYVSRRPCRKCASVGLRYMRGKRCYFCDQKRRATTPSPRQAAIASGDKWYTPTTACKQCRTIAERRVDNGQCRGCSPAPVAPKRDTVDAELMRDAPDLVLTRVDARAMGFKVFRTGNYCRRGHNGYRYVSTGNCIECLRG